MRELKKHEDNRGILFEILRRDETADEIKHIYFSVSKSGAVRGDHHHKRKVEWFCVVKGRAKLIVEDINTNEKKEVILDSEKPTIVKIPPYVKHQIKNIGRGRMYLIAVTNEVFDPDDPDTYKS